MLCTNNESLIIIIISYSNSEKLKESVEKRECAGFPLKGNAFNVETTSNNVKQCILQKIDERYQDLHDDILDATTIGSLKN